MAKAKVTTTKAVQSIENAAKSINTDSVPIPMRNKG